MHIHGSASLLILNAAAVKARSGGLSLLPPTDISNVYSLASLQYLTHYYLALSYTPPPDSISVVFCSDVLCTRLVLAHNKRKQEDWQQIPQ